MAAKHLESDVVKKGMSVRKAAKTFGIPSSTLCDHLAIINRIQNCTKEQTEGLITTAVNAVTAGRLSDSRAARVYGIAERTVRNHMKKPHALRGRPTVLTESEEEALKQILIRLGKLNCGLTKCLFSRVKINYYDMDKKIPEIHTISFFRLFPQLYFPATSG